MNGLTHQFKLKTCELGTKCIVLEEDDTPGGISNAIFIVKAKSMKIKIICNIENRNIQIKI